MKTYINFLSLMPPPAEDTARIEAILSECGKIIEYQPREVIANLQEDFTHIYFIKSGRTSHVISDENNEKLLYQLTPGWIFGSMCPGSLPEDNITVYAQERTVVCRVPHKDYLSLLMSDPEFSSYCLTLLGRLHSYLASEIGNLSFNSCKTRLMRIYCAQVDERKLSDDGKWYCLDGKLTHSELATTVGSARVTISKLINELCDDGFLRLINRRAQVNISAYHRFLSKMNGD